MLTTLLFIAGYTLLMLYIANQNLTNNPSSLYKILYAAVLMIPVVWVFAFQSSMLLNFITQQKTSSNVPGSIVTIGLIIGITCFLFGINMFLNTVNNLVPVWWPFIVFSTGVLILAILFDMLRYIGVHIDVRSNKRSVFVLILKIIFYIPCMFRAALLFVQNEIQLTTNPGITTVIIEIFLLLGILYYQNFLKAIIRHPDEGGSLVINEPLYLNKLQTIKSLASSSQKIQSDSLSAKRFPWHFSISCWVFMNHHSTNYLAYSKDSSIFRLGNVSNLNRSIPGLSFRNMDVSGNSGSIGSYVVQYEESNEEENLIKLQLPLSVWTHFVFNYSDTNVFDLFVDGKLINSRRMTTALSLDDFDQFIVGESNGLDGSICNTIYFPYALSLRAIETQYKLLQSVNPPITHFTKK